MRWTLAISCCLFAASAFAREPGPHASLRKQLAGLGYPEARERLTKLGWTPAPPAVPISDAPARWFLDHGFAEVESCTEGQIVCSFAFRNVEGQCLHVVTLGAANRARVERIDRRCF